MKDEREKDGYSDPAFEPRTVQEALEAVRALREDLRTSKLMTIEEGDEEVAYSESKKGKRVQARIDELIEKYSEDQIFIDYLAGEEVDEKLQTRLEKERRIKDQEKVVEKLERKIEELQDQLIQAREHLRKLEEE